MSDRYAGSNTSRRIGNQTGRFNQKSTQVYTQHPGKTFLEYQLELLRRAGIKDIILCLGHMGEQIERHFGNGRNYGVNIDYSYEEKPLGAAGALKKAENMLAWAGWYYGYHRKKLKNMPV